MHYYTNDEIAVELNCSTKTISRTKAKLGHSNKKIDNEIYLQIVDYIKGSDDANKRKVMLDKQKSAQDLKVKKIALKYGVELEDGAELETLLANLRTSYNFNLQLIESYKLELDTYFIENQSYMIEYSNKTLSTHPADKRIGELEREQRAIAKSFNELSAIDGTSGAEPTFKFKME